MRHHLRLFALIPLLITSGGCGRSSDSGASETLTRYAVATAPSIVIGDDSMGPEYALDQVMAATRLSNGQIVVVNGISSELRFYGSDGVHVRTVGGSGSGPGEYRAITGLHRLPGDSLLVASFRPGVTLLSPEGDFVRSETIDMGRMRVLCRLGEGGMHLLPDRTYFTVLEDNFYGSDCPPTPGPIWRHSALVGHWDWRSGTFDTLAIMPATERNDPNYRVYGALLVVATSPERMFALDTRSDTIHAWSYDGLSHSVMVHPFSEEPIPRKAKAQDRRRWTDRAGEKRVGNEYVYPETYPRVARMLVDGKLNLWIMKYPRMVDPISSVALALAYAALAGPDPTEWVVLSADGKAIAQATLPAGLFPLEIGEDYVLGVARDELDVQTVQLYSLER